MTVLGIGINDAGYRVTQIVDGKQVVCPYYAAWKSMLTRCYGKNKKPAYASTLVDARWYSFSAFRTWAVEQYDHGYQLDKDILSVGNSTYSPDTCCFVPTYINKLISGYSRGELPYGVCEVRKNIRNKYASYCDDVGLGRRHLGLHATPESAHRAWQDAKIIAIHSAIQKWESSGLKVHGAVVVALEARAARIGQDIEVGVVTEGL